jgi:hypothetical protein
VRDGPRILDMIEQDLRAIHVYNLKDGNVLHGVAEQPAACAATASTSSAATTRAAA